MVTTISKLRERIRRLIKEADTTQTALGEKIGIGSGHISKILSGADGRALRLHHLEALAKGLGVPISAFFEDPVRVPVVGAITAFQKISSEALNGGPVESAEYVDAYPEDPMLAKLYAVTVADRSMMPVIQAGTILTAQRDTWDAIKNEELVIFHGSDGMAEVRRITITPQNIILRGLNPAVEDLVLPKSYIRQCDRIIRAHF